MAPFQARSTLRSMCPVDKVSRLVITTSKLTGLLISKTFISIYRRCPSPRIARPCESYVGGRAFCWIATSSWLNLSHSLPEKIYLGPQITCGLSVGDGAVRPHCLLRQFRSYPIPQKT